MWRGLDAGSTAAQLAGLQARVARVPAGLAAAANVEQLIGIMQEISRVRTVLEAYTGEHYGRSRFADLTVAGGAIRVVRDFERLNTAVGRLWATPSSLEASEGSLPKALLAATGSQLLTATRSTALVVVILAGDHDETDALTRAIAHEGGAAARESWVANDRELAVWLGRFGPEFTEAYAGAVHVVRRRGTDLLRQMAISARELLDHLMMRLAHDADVVAWYTPACGARPSSAPYSQPGNAHGGVAWGSWIPPLSATGNMQCCPLSRRCC